MIARSLWVRVVYSALAVVLCAAGAEGAETYHVGVSKVDITPAYPIRLNGFGFRRDESIGVSQKIWAKALAIRHGEEPPAVVIAIDSLGVRMPLVDEVAKRLHERFQIPRERVMLTFSHSHCTPKVNGACDNIFSTPIPPPHQEHIDQYTQELTDRIFEAASAAIADLQPGTLEWNVGQVGFAKNRRTPGGPVDHDLPLLVVRDPDRQIRAIYVSYACHCVTLSFNQISGDWSGYAQEHIEREFPGAVALVSIGCGSDSNPTSGVTGDKTEVAAEQGAEIAAEVVRLLREPGRPISGPLRAQLEFIDLPLNQLPTKEQLEELVKAGGPAGYNAETQLARLARGEKLIDALHYPVQTLAFGDSLQMIFLAGEVCVDYALRLKTELDRDRVWLNGYSNDFCAYIPSERLVREGRYGGGAETPYFALPTTLQAGLEQKIVDEVRRQAGTFLASKKGTQGVPPKTPDESLQCFHVPDTLRIELVAAEPLVADPVAIDFGPDGRLWVVEMTDYARGVNDDFQPTGRVRFLTDTDGDGRFDKSTEFLNGLRFPTDVKVWRDGVLICDAPEIVFASDTDGDGRADVRQPLFQGFATHNPHARVNSLRFGLDNWLYGSGGLFGGKISNRAGEIVDVTNRDFRLQPDAGVIEAVTGQTQQGRPQDDWNNWFGCTNGSLLFHHVVEDHYARRNPHFAPPSPTHYVPDYPDSQRLYPRGDLVLFKLSGTPGRPTSACGAEIYRDDLLGAEFYGNSFTCEPVNQLVHRLQLQRKGVTFAGQRAEQERNDEFLTSTDRWFRPVQVRTGNDGALWVVDMYRYVIEHPQWIPPETIAELNVLAGQGLGRIYRIVPQDGAARSSVRLADLPDGELAAALDSSNGVQRDLVQQMLLWREATAAVPQLEKLLSSSRAPVRVQAACTLAGLGSLRAEHLRPLFTDPIAEVRRHAVRLAEPLLDSNPELRATVAKMVDDPAPETRLQVAYSLGESPDASGGAALARLAVRPDNDAYLNAAIMSSVRRDNVVAVLRGVMGQTQGAQGDKLVESLLTFAAAVGDSQTVAATIGELARQSGPRLQRWRTFAKILDAADRRELVLRDAISDEDRERIRAVMREARQTLLEPEVSEEERIAAILLIGRTTGKATQSVDDAHTDDEDRLAELLSPRYLPSIQNAAAAGIARRAGNAAPAMLLARWPDATPRLRSELLGLLLAREGWASEVLGALEAGVVKAGDLDAVRRQQLLTHRDQAVRERAQKLFASSGISNRSALVAAWSDVAAQSGDETRGKEAFRKHCSACHQLHGVGFQVGPDLAALTNKSANALLVAVLDPNRDVDGRYVNYIAALADGRTVSGMLVNESANSVTLREQGGKDHVLLRTDLDEFQATGKSVMPEGLEKDLTRQDLADVIAYLQSTRVPPKTFAGNMPAVITPSSHGEMSLLATNAEIFGGDIAFESDSPHQNIGYWHGANDYAGWQVRLPAAGRFDVYLDFSCANESAGNGFRLEGGEPILRGLVPATGGWANYRIAQVGTTELPAGSSYVTLRFDGTPRRPALLDLRGIYLIPAGIEPVAFQIKQRTVEVPADPTTLAERLLDEQHSSEQRQNWIAEHPQLAAEIIAAMVKNLPRDEAEEYRRIPWIWRVAIACGKRNQADELRAVLDVSMPQGGQPLRDWQAVVIGGGIINGVSLAGVWPKERIEEVLKVEGILVARWQRSIELAAAMADDDKIRSGTRYDALRMIAMGPWDLRGAQLRKYLAKDAHPELQMGAVSGVADMQHPQAAAVLIEHLPGLTERNRTLALDGLLRSKDRCLKLLDAVADGRVTVEQLGADRVRKLREHEDAAVRKRAAEMLDGR